MKKNTIVGTLLLIGTTGVAGCGGLSEEDAAKGWGATFAAVGPLQAGAAGRVAEGAKNVACAAGGSGDVTMTQGETALTLDVTFHDCNSAGVIINGPLNWSYEASGTQLKYDFTGDLSWSGEVEGDCELGFHLEMNGGAGTYSGEICGYDTGDLSL